MNQAEVRRRDNTDVGKETRTHSIAPIHGADSSSIAAPGFHVSFPPPVIAISSRPPLLSTMRRTLSPLC